MRIAYLVPVMILSLVCGSFFADSVSSIVVDIAWAQEHPEHPEHPATEEGSAAKEHLEHTVKEKKPLTIESVALYLEGYAAEHAAKQGGWMKLQDEEKEKTLELKLDKVHRERLAKTGEGTYFVCADFLTPEGKSYDLDFWVKETDKGLEVTETTIHKEEGVARYNWVEKDGIWSRKPLEK